MHRVEHLIRLSDDALTDALSGQLSPRGRLDAAFESGYCALLYRLPPDVVDAHEHPALPLIPAGVGREYVAHRFDGHERWLPSFEALIAWAMECRGHAGIDQTS